MSRKRADVVCLKMENLYEGELTCLNGVGSFNVCSF
jgi:hypothetical protein